MSRISQPYADLWESPTPGAASATSATGSNGFPSRLVVPSYTATWTDRDLQESPPKCEPAEAAPEREIPVTCQRADAAPEQKPPTNTAPVPPVQTYVVSTNIVQHPANLYLYKWPKQSLMYRLQQIVHKYLSEAHWYRKILFHEPETDYSKRYPLVYVFSKLQEIGVSCGLYSELLLNTRGSSKKSYTCEDERSLEALPWLYNYETKTATLCNSRLFSIFLASMFAETRMVIDSIKPLIFVDCEKRSNVERAFRKLTHKRIMLSNIKDVLFDAETNRSIFDDKPPKNSIGPMQVPNITSAENIVVDSEASFTVKKSLYVEPMLDYLEVKYY